MKLLRLAWSSLRASRSQSCVSDIKYKDGDRLGASAKQFTFGIRLANSSDEVWGINQAQQQWHKGPLGYLHLVPSVRVLHISQHNSGEGRGSLGEECHPFGDNLGHVHGSQGIAERSTFDDGLDNMVEEDFLGPEGIGVSDGLLRLGRVCAVSPRGMVRLKLRMRGRVVVHGVEQGRRIYVTEPAQDLYIYRYARVDAVGAGRGWSQEDVGNGDGRQRISRMNQRHELLELFWFQARGQAFSLEVEPLVCRALQRLLRRVGSVHYHHVVGKTGKVWPRS